MRGSGGSGASFDWKGYLVQTTESERERLERELEAKQAQLRYRCEMHDAAVTSLKDRLRNVDWELDRCTRTSDDRPRLERRRDRLKENLGETRERFAADKQELEDAILDLRAELEKLCEAEELLENALDHSGS